MKKLYLALMFVLCAVVARAQTIYAPGGINYGSGFIEKKTWGLGAPNPLTCNGFNTYWQADATTSPIWVCLAGTYTNVGGSTTQSGTSYAVTTTATGLQTLSGPIQPTYIQIGSSSQTLYSCGAKCLALGSSTSAVDGSLQVNALTGSANGVLNAALFSGADILAKAQAAFTSCSNDCTVYIPAGTYSGVTSTLTMPNTQSRYALIMDPSAVIGYTGTGCAIAGPTIAGGTNHDDQIIGGWIMGTASGKAGICLNPINHIVVRDVKVSGFTNTASQSVGNGIFDAGANSVEIEDVSLFGNKTGLAGTEITNYSSIGVHIIDSDISNNSAWGIATFDSHVSATQENTWLIEGNIIEDNGTGGIDLAHSNDATIIANHFEGNAGLPIRLNNGYNGYNNKAIGNFFISNSGHSYQVQVVNGFNTKVDDNYETASGTVSPCFVGVTNAGDVEVEHNTVVSTNTLCYPGTSGGWIRQFDNTLSAGTLSSPSGDPVQFPQGMSTSGTVSGGTVSSTNKVIAGTCLQTNGNGSTICSGAGAPSNPCTLGGNLYLNTTVVSGSYPMYVCRNGGWQGLGTTY